MTIEENGPVEEIDPTIHLLRGAPSVRSWSKYQQTVPNWALCGRKRQKKKNDAGPLEWRPTPKVTEDPDLVTCRYCHMLMADTPQRKGQPDANHL